MLEDSMDINEFVKVKLFESKENSKSCYVNGTVINKRGANSRIKTKIMKPRILLLEALATKTDSEGHIDTLIEHKISKINPEIVIIQKDYFQTISSKLMTMMQRKNITVITELDARKMKRLARLTQTIVLPSLNFYDSSFPLGRCKKFR